MTKNSTMTKKAEAYKLPIQTTPEALECRWNKVLSFGDKTIMAGYYYDGTNELCYFGAVYEFVTEDTTCEGAIELKALSEVEFEDDGHAMAWAMNA